MSMTAKDTNADSRGRKPPPHPTESLQTLDARRPSSPPPPSAIDEKDDDDDGGDVVVAVAVVPPHRKGRRGRNATMVGIGGASSSSSSRRGKPPLASNPRVARALAEAEYEALVDPYRGMAPSFSLTNAIDFNRDNNRLDGFVDDDRMVDERGMGGGGGIPPISSSVERPHRSSSDIEREWPCDNCTLLNPSRNTVCEACGGTPRHHAACGVHGGPIPGIRYEDGDGGNDDDEFRGGGGKDGEVNRRRVDGRESSSNCNDPSSDAAARDSRESTSRSREEGAMMNAMVDPDEIRSPWVACRDAIVVSGDGDAWSFHNIGRGREVESEMTEVDDIAVVVIDHDDEHRREENDTTNDGVPILVKCGCPTVDGWAEAELEAYGKRLIADAKKTAKRKKGGAGRQDGVATSNKNARNNGGGRGKCEDDDSIVKSQNRPENFDSRPSRNAHLICGERKHDAGTLHPCDFNPVS
jgi:hypothetical protein